MRLPSALRSAAFALALTPLLLSCRGGSSGPADTGIPERELTIVEHLRGLGARMTDSRLRAELFAELAIAEAKVATPEAIHLASEAVQAAAAIAQKLPAGDDHDRASEKVAGALAATGEVEPALSLAATIRDAAVRSEALAAVARTLAEAGDFTRAALIAEKIPGEEPRGDALVAAVRAAARVGSFEVAQKLVRSCPKVEARAEGFAAIAEAHAADRRFKDAERLLDAIESGHFRGVAQGAIVVAYYRDGQVERADRLARAIESSWIQARTYADLALVAAEDKNTAESTRLLAKALSIAEGIHDKTMMSSALEDVVVRGLSRNLVKEALEVARRCPSPDARNHIFARTAARLAKDHRFDEARATAEKITADPIGAADALGAIAQAYADMNDDEHALEVVAAIPTLSLRLAPLARVVASSEAAHRALTSLVLVHLQRALEVK